MKIKMELSNKQILTIKKALDLYSRVLCGQIEEVTRTIERTDFSKGYTKEQKNKAAIGVDQIKRAMFSEIYPATYGISSEEKLTKKAAVAFDIFQVIEKFTTPKTKYTNFDVLRAGKEDLPTIEQC